jgi:hypothetical protein
MPFGETMTSGAVTCFQVGSHPKSFLLGKFETLDKFLTVGAGRSVGRGHFESKSRWSAVIEKREQRRPAGFVELGELCRVHRGQVTGGNRVWISGAYPGELPSRFLVRTITRAKELITAAPLLTSAKSLRDVIDLPPDLRELEFAERQSVERFLVWARDQGAHTSYVAAHRRAWWAVGLHSPAPILCTYMARRPPAFVRNRCNVRHLNIAHGFYPRDRLDEPTLMALIGYLSHHVRIDAGRTYAGGLTKFEPRELERILIPPLEELHGIAPKMDLRAAES